MKLNASLPLRQFVIITLITSIWIHISEVFRYFVFVMPKTRDFFNNKSGIAEMDWGIFAIWGLWDTLLTSILVYIFWLYAQKYGNNTRSIFTTGVIVWASIFVIFWVATANMGLSDWKILAITLPLSLIEMIIGAFIISKLFHKGLNNNVIHQ